MRLQRRWIAAGLFLLLTAVTAAAILTGNGNTAQAARDVVHTFLQSEFNGEVLDEREKIILFSPKRLVDIERDEPGPGPGPYVLYMASRPVFVVSAAEIVSVKVEANRATAVVSYRRLARIDRIGTKELAILPSKKNNDLVTLNLVFDKKKWWSLRGQWWILDPPPPRVSKQVMIEYYEYDVKEYSSMWERELNDPSYSAKQKALVRASRDKATGNLRFLKSLP